MMTWLMSQLRRWPALSVFDCLPRPAWRWPLIVFAIGLSLGPLSLPAVSQTGPERRHKVYDRVIGGVQFRVPAEYMQPANIPTYSAGGLSFSFWVSDGKPVAEGVPDIGATGRVG